METSSLHWQIYLLVACSIVGTIYTLLTMLVLNHPSRDSSLMQRNFFHSFVAACSARISTRTIHFIWSTAARSLWKASRRPWTAGSWHVPPVWQMPVATAASTRHCCSLQRRQHRNGWAWALEWAWAWRDMPAFHVPPRRVAAAAHLQRLPRMHKKREREI